MTPRSNGGPRRRRGDFQFRSATNYEWAAGVRTPVAARERDIDGGTCITLRRHQDDRVFREFLDADRLGPGNGVGLRIEYVHGFVEEPDRQIRRADVNIGDAELDGLLAYVLDDALAQGVNQDERNSRSGH